MIDLAIKNLLAIKLFIESNTMVNQEIADNFSGNLNSLEKIYSALEINGKFIDVIEILK